MYTLGPFNLSKPVSLDPKASNLFNNQPIQAILLQNNSSSYVVFEYGSGTADYIPPFGPYLLQITPTISPKGIIANSLAANPLPTDSLIATVYQNGDNLPGIQNVPSPTAVSLSNSSLGKIVFPAGASGPYTIPIPANVHSIRFWTKLATANDTATITLVGVQTGIQYNNGPIAVSNGVNIAVIAVLDTQLTLNFTAASSAGTLYIDGASDPGLVEVIVVNNTTQPAPVVSVGPTQTASFAANGASINVITIPANQTYHFYTLQYTEYNPNAVAQETDIEGSGGLPFFARIALGQAQQIDDTVDLKGFPVTGPNTISVLVTTGQQCFGSIHYTPF